jgi:TFIIF-interacting CTD phosphatase-like protein
MATYEYRPEVAIKNKEWACACRNVGLLCDLQQNRLKEVRQQLQFTKFEWHVSLVENPS